MLPSRGLRPAQFVPLAARQSTALRSKASRQHSSLHRTAALCAASCRPSPLQPAPWRPGATRSSHKMLTASSVRYASWYAPWSWGKSSAPASGAVSGTWPDCIPDGEDASRPVSELAAQHASQHTQSAVTAATPDMAPAAMDKPAVVDGASHSWSETAAAGSSMDELLSMPVPHSALPTAQIDPSQLIDHAGQLQELGLDYGWGMTTMFEKLIEHIYLTSGWGWAGSIVLAGVSVRCVTFYFQAMSSDKMAVMAAMRPVTQPLQEKMEAAIARGDEQQTSLLRMQQREVMKPYVGSMASMAGFMLLQGWVGISVFRCLRAMGEMPVPGMAHDGFLWFADLTVKDPYFLLPIATTAVMYTVFKTGGETGITEATGAGAIRAKIMSGLAVFIGCITAFQPAALQLYFLTSGVLGGVTGWLLRQNWFRAIINIRPIPSPESNALYSKVARGEIKLNQLKTPDGKMRYQAANTTTRPPPKPRTALVSGIKVKPGTPMPAHLRPSPSPVAPPAAGPPSRDDDLDEGAAGKPLTAKLDYYRRNYRPIFVARRLAMGLERMVRGFGLGGKQVNVEAERRKRKAQAWEVERRRRFEERK